MNGIIGHFRLGEDLGVALDALAGDPAAVTLITARMKPARARGNRLELDHAAAGLALEVAARGAAGWTLSLPGSATAVLDPGIYGLDARLAFAGGVEMTEQTAFVSLSRAAVA